MQMCVVPSQQVCLTFLPPHLMTRTKCMVCLYHIIQQVSIYAPCKLYMSNLLYVEVAGDPQAVAVSGKVVPPVHINPILLVVYNLRSFLYDLFITV